MSEDKEQKVPFKRSLTPPSNLKFLKVTQVRLERMMRQIGYLEQSYKYCLAFCYNTSEPSTEFNEVFNALDSIFKELNGYGVKISDLLLLIRERPGYNPQENTLQSNWENLRKKVLTCWQNFQEAHFKWLDQNGKGYLQESFTKITDCFNDSSETTRDELLHEVNIRLLERYLSEKITPYYKPAPPSCFICFSWGSPTQAIQIYKVAEHLRQAGINVHQDIQGSIAKHNSLLDKVNHPIVMGTPDFTHKWDDYVNEKEEKDHRSNIFIAQVKNIETRIREKKNESSVVRILITGSFQESFPSSLRDVLSYEDFRNGDYCTNFFGLLKNLPKLGVDKTSHEKKIDQFQNSFKKEYTELTGKEFDELIKHIGAVKPDPKKAPETPLPLTLEPSASPQNYPTEEKARVREEKKQSDPDSGCKEEISSPPAFSFLPGRNVIIAATGIDVMKESSSSSSTASTPSSDPQPSTIIAKTSPIHKEFLKGVSDFKKMVNSRGKIIDKSLFIKDVVDESRRTNIMLILRPSEFGKTLNLSMLYYFFDRAQAREGSRKLFEGGPEREPAEICKNDKWFNEHCGKYPVIFLTLKNIRGNNFNEALDFFRLTISELYKDLLNKYNFERTEEIDRIIKCKANKSELQLSLVSLTIILKEKCKKNVIILIDDYEKPLHMHIGYIKRNHSHFSKKDKKKHMEDFYEEVSDFIKGLLCPALNGNDKNLQFAVLTGIFLESEIIFPDLKNTTICSILTDKFDRHFGFSEEEVDGLLQQLFGPKIDEALLKDISNWCGGYKIGKTHLFNPVSVIRFLQENQKETIRKASNFKSKFSIFERDLLQKLVRLNDSNSEIQDLPTKKLLKQLVVFGRINKVIYQSMVLHVLDKNPTMVWSFLLLAGYLTISDDETSQLSEQHSLVIPNEEFYEIYANFVENCFKDEELKLPGFKNLPYKIVRDSGEDTSKPTTSPEDSVTSSTPSSYFTEPPPPIYPCSSSFFSNPMNWYIPQTQNIADTHDVLNQSGS